MKNLIYQVWAGDMRPGCRYSEKLFREYAERVGADYRLDISPNIASKYVKGKNGMYFEWLNPMLDDSFLEYDKVCVIDLDVFPVENLNTNIFDEPIKDFGICTEPFQGKYRESTTIGKNINKKSDERWGQAVKSKYGATMPRDADGHLKVYNAGMVMFTKKGMHLAREKFVPFKEYMDYIKSCGLGRFYRVDQNYFHAMMVTHSEYTEMHNGWNNYIHGVAGPLALQDAVNDSRDASTKFVHVQLRGADYFSDEQLYHITNSARSKWKVEGIS